MGRTWKFQLFSYCTPQQPLTTICIDLLDPFRYENSPEDYIVWIGPNIHNKMWMKIYLIINGIDAINIITSKISCIIANDRVVSSLNHILFIFRYILLLLCLMRAYERMIWCDDFDFLFQCFFFEFCPYVSFSQSLIFSLVLSFSSFPIESSFINIVLWIFIVWLCVLVLCMNDIRLFIFVTALNELVLSLPTYSCSETESMNEWNIWKFWLNYFLYEHLSICTLMTFASTIYEIIKNGFLKIG